LGALAVFTTGQISRSLLDTPRSSGHNSSVPTINGLRYLEAAPRAASSSGGQSPGTLVLVHGFPLGARMWESQLALADRGWRVIAPQLRGFDGGTTSSVATSVDDFAGDVIDLLDALHVDNAVIGGLSMGGYITFAIFRHAPRYFRAMVLADTRAQADSPEAVEARKRMHAQVLRDGPSAVADEMMPKLVCESTLRERPDVVAVIRGLIMSNAPETVAGAVMALMSRPDSTPLLSQIHCPTLILVGHQDTLTPPPLSQDMHRAIAGSELQLIADAGHVSNMEQPAAFNLALAHFLEHRV
jgi:3-oxoadipate enol-lactonase